jgi:hypothetical protein
MLVVHMLRKTQHTWPKCFHNGIDVLRLNAVDDVVAAPGDEVAALHDLNFGLERLSMLLLVVYIAILHSP